MVQGRPFGSCGPKQDILLQNQKFCLFVGKSTRYDSACVRVRKWDKRHPISRLIVAFDHSQEPISSWSGDWQSAFAKCWAQGHDEEGLA